MIRQEWLPPGFYRYDEDCIGFGKDFICSYPLRVMPSIEIDEKLGRFCTLEFKDDDDREHSIPIPIKWVEKGKKRRLSKVISILSSHGLKINPKRSTKSKLLDYIDLFYKMNNKIVA